jgi:hypothetical protein
MMNKSGDAFNHIVEYVHQISDQSKQANNRSLEVNDKA